MDKKIVTDPYLYKMYLIQFGELLDQLSNEVLKRVFENTYAELYPYYSNDEIISNSKYDLYKETNLKKLESEMLSLYKKLVFYRATYLKDLADENK